MPNATYRGHYLKLLIKIMKESELKGRGGQFKLKTLYFDEYYVPGLKSIALISWDDYDCGGWPSIKLENPDGTHCETEERSLAAGATLLWSFYEDYDSCWNMSVTENTILYIKTSSGNDFCPKRILVTLVNGPAYITNEISEWYDKDKTNNKKHLLQECKNTRNKLLKSCYNGYRAGGLLA